MPSPLLLDQSIDADNRVLAPVLQPPSRDAHKHDRGHVAVMSGPALATGASRLSAQGALGMGAGLVTLYGEREALMEHSAHVTAIMLAETDVALLGEGRRIDACVVGPGHGGSNRTRGLVLELLARYIPIVLDADALTAFTDKPDQLFAACNDRVVMTPHAGEFTKLFGSYKDVEAAASCRDAASRAGCVVVLKSSTTIIAEPDGRWAQNDHASPWLATAGSGDILSGMVAALLGQGSDPFDAACAAVWLHGDIGFRHGPGLVADRMAGWLPSILKARLEETE